MYKLVMYRLGHSVVLIFGVVTVVFFTNFLLGDPVRVMLPASTPPEAVEEFRRQMGSIDRFWFSTGNSFPMLYSWILATAGGKSRQVWKLL